MASHLLHLTVPQPLAVVTDTQIDVVIILFRAWGWVGVRTAGPLRITRSSSIDMQVVLLPSPSEVFISFWNAPRHLLTPRGARVLSHKEKITFFPISHLTHSLIFFIRCTMDY